MEASSKQQTSSITESSGEVRVGIRELRHDFRAWLDRARAGERIIVTDRGEPIAELSPHRPKRTWLQRMYDEGQVIRATGSFADLPPLTGPITTRGTDALQEMREDRV